MKSCSYEQKVFVHFINASRVATMRTTMMQWVLVGMLGTRRWLRKAASNIVDWRWPSLSFHTSCCRQRPPRYDVGRCSLTNDRHICRQSTLNSLASLYRTASGRERTRTMVRWLFERSTSPFSTKTFFISVSTSFWYQFLYFQLTYSFTHHFFLFCFTTLLNPNSPLFLFGIPVKDDIVAENWAKN